MRRIRLHIKSHMDDAREGRPGYRREEFATNKLCVVADKKAGKVKSIKDLGTRVCASWWPSTPARRASTPGKCWEKMAADKDFGADFVKALGRTSCPRDQREAGRFEGRDG